MFVAKNDDGTVILFYSKPKHKDGYWLSSDGKYFNIDSGLFPNLTNDDYIEVGIEQVTHQKCKFCGKDYLYRYADVIDGSEPDKEFFWYYTKCPYCDTENNAYE